MLMTINRCIDYTKASKGMKLVPKYETMDLQEALKLPIDCMTNMQARIEIKLMPILEQICSHVMTDKQWFQENVLCLLSNAVKYSSAGRVDIKISLVDIENENGTKQQDAGEGKFEFNINNFPLFLFDYGGKKNEKSTVVMLLIEIEDTGIGVSDEMMTKLFTPFKQAQRLAGGTGLGLFSLAKRIEALGGRYGVRSRDDCESGSVFWFAVPYRPDKETSKLIRETDMFYTYANKNASAQSNNQFESNFEAETKVDSSIISTKLRSNSILSSRIEDSFTGTDVLVVDDSLSILKMTAALLKRNGFNVEQAENGVEALEKILQRKTMNKPYDVVLMDFQMPIMDGLEVFVNTNNKMFYRMNARRNTTSKIAVIHNILVVRKNHNLSSVVPLTQMLKRCRKPLQLGLIVSL
jgi:CheY-like chemotaxis protein